MNRHVRNNAMAGLSMLIGALLVGFGATQPWASVSTELLQRWGLSPQLDFGLEHMPSSSGALNLEPYVVGVAVFIGLLAMALIATRIRGLGVLWRLLALLGVVALGLLAWALWTVVDDPGSLAENSAQPTVDGVGGALVSLAQKAGAASVQPGLGLWLLTLGTALVLVGACIPATRRTVIATPPAMWGSAGTPSAADAPHAPAGWYVDPGHPAFVRWFDGHVWTQQTQPRRP